MKLLMRVLMVVAALSGPASAADYAPGTWRVITKEQQPKWMGTLVKPFTLDGYTEHGQPQSHSAQATLLSWPAAAPDQDGSSPVKYILVFAGIDAGHPARSNEEAKSWFELRGATEGPFLIECSADVRQLLDMNLSDDKWTCVYLFVEFANGRRALAKMDDELRYEPEKHAAKIDAKAIRIPEGYAFTPEQIGELPRATAAPFPGR